MNTRYLMSMVIAMSMGFVGSIWAQEKGSSSDKDLSYSDRLSHIGDSKTNEKLGTVSGRDKGEMRKRDLVDSYSYIPDRGLSDRKIDEKEHEQLMKDYDVAKAEAAKFSKDDFSAAAESARAKATIAKQKMEGTYDESYKLMPVVDDRLTKGVGDKEKGKGTGTVKNETRTPKEMHEAALKGEYGKDAQKAAEDWAKKGGTFDDDGRMDEASRMNPKESHEAALRGEFGKDAQKAAEEWAKKGGGFNEDGTFKSDPTIGGTTHTVVDFSKLQQWDGKTDGKVRTVDNVFPGSTQFNMQSGSPKDPAAMHQAALRGEMGVEAQKAAKEWGMKSGNEGFRGAMDSSKGMNSMGWSNNNNNPQMGQQHGSNMGSNMGNTTNMNMSNMSNMNNMNMSNMMNNMPANSPAMNNMNSASTSAMHEAAMRGDYGPEAQRSATEWQNTQPQPQPQQ